MSDRHGARPGRKPTPNEKIVEGSGRDNKIPDMPPAHEYGLQRFNPDTTEIQPIDWPDVCKKTWRMIWTSELAANYVDSDRLQAELAITHLAASVDPGDSASGRRAAAKAYQDCLVQLGLTPSARSKLKLDIVKADEAETRRERRSPAPPQHGSQAEIIDLYKRYR